MPLISVSTSTEINEKNIFMKDCSQLLSRLTNKPEKYVMVCLLDQIPMCFGQDLNPSCYVDIKSIGSIDPLIMSGSISDFILKKLNIPSNKTYIRFENIEASNWAWDGKPFG